MYLYKSRDIGFPLSVVYKRYLKPRSLLNDTDFLQGEFVSTLLESIGIDQGYVFSDLISIVKKGFPALKESQEDFNQV